MCHIIYNLSWWGDKAGNSFNSKNNYIKEHCKAEIAQTLFDIFKSQNIVTKYKEALEDTIKDKKHSLYLYTLCILNIMDIPTSLSILDEIIEEFDFKILDKIEFKNIFNVDIFNKDITYKSPIFSTMILKELFDWGDIIEYSLNILEKLSDKKREFGLKYLLNDIRTNLYRFKFIERILSDKNKKEALRHYYEKIKEKIYGIEQDPQYWLQYAMCHIMFKYYDKAQRLLNNAYDKASGRENYDTYRIDNQQARLYLKKLLYMQQI